MKVINIKNLSIIDIDTKISNFKNTYIGNFYIKITYIISFFA